MPPGFEELDYRQTELGELILRRRRPVSQPDRWVYEVKLAGRFLMSSLVTDSERALASLALQRVPGDALRVLVGGLGLGYTAAAALDEPRTAAVDVVERLHEVVDWHRRGLVPLGGRLVAEPRCRLLVGDCFAALQAGSTPAYDAVLIDIDDSPIHLLHGDHESFYSVEGLRAARRGLRPGGVLALWTSLPAEPEVTARLAAAFAAAEAVEVGFDNPLLEAREVNALYFARA